MTTDEKCWGENEGFQGCAACPQMGQLFDFYRGGKLPISCTPKIRRALGGQEKFEKVMLERAKAKRLDPRP